MMFDAESYYDAILAHDAQSQEVAYNLLTQRLNVALRTIYENYSFALTDDFDDSIDDFYLYLFEGDRGDVFPFSLLKRLHDKRSLFRWVVATYRYYLLKKVDKWKKQQELVAKISGTAGEETGTLSDETMIIFLATAIAYANQEFSPRNRFVLFRMLLTFLDHRTAIPQEPVAQALGMNPVTYRVCAKRQKDRFIDLIKQQEMGQTLALDPWHRQMRDHIIEGFDVLYETLEDYYERVMQEMHGVERFQSLREGLSETYGMMMHEDRPYYGVGRLLPIRQIYERLKNHWSLRDRLPLPETGREQVPILPPSNGLFAR